MTAPTTARGDYSLAPAYAAAAVAVIIWGATPAATKFAVIHMDPLVAGILRTVIAGALVLPIAVIARLTLPSDRLSWALLAASSLGGFVAFTLFFSYGVEQTSASHAALINAGIPIFTGIFGVIAERRLPGRLWFTGVAVAFLGGILLITARGPGIGDATVVGDLLCVMASMSAALAYVSGAHLARRIGTISVIFWGLALAAVVQFPILVWAGTGTDWAAINNVGWMAVIYLAVGASILAYLAWIWALAVGGAVRMGTVQFAMPIISLSLAVILFNETMTMALLVAAVMIVAGIALARRG
jgi:drug/metabolite transporter (DMT)-like permease